MNDFDDADHEIPQHVLDRLAEMDAAGDAEDARVDTREDPRRDDRSESASLRELVALGIVDLGGEG